MVSALKLIEVAPKYLGTPYSQMDCQAFVERCLADIGIKKDLAGSNTWYREIAKHGWVGTPKECRKKYGSIPRGAFLFIQKNDGKEPQKYIGDGIGNISHIGIYTGMTGYEMVQIAKNAGVKNAAMYDFGKGAIHSSQSRGCVCTSNFNGKSIDGGWNRVGLWDRIDYGVESHDESEGKQMAIATVWADGGSTVNLRTKPTSSASLVDRIPIGTEAEVETESGDWSYIHVNGKNGYMMTKYLVSEVPEKADDGKIVVDRELLETAYRQIGNLLGYNG